MKFVTYNTKYAGLGLSYVLSFLFIFIGVFQIKNFDTIVIKLGMSHFFASKYVDFIVGLVIGLNFIATIMILFLNNISAYFISLSLLVFYTGYSWALMKTTDSFCGCGNIFIDLDLRIQIGIGIVLSLGAILYIIDLYKKRVSNVNCA